MINETKLDILNLIHQAKKDGVFVFLKGEELNIKVEEGKVIDKDLLRELKENKSGIISFLKKNSQNNRKTISVYTGDDLCGIPLSYAQERLWFIDELSGSLHYHIPIIFRISGSLDIDILEKSFQSLIDRHQALRTVISEEDGVAYQELKPSSDFRCMDLGKIDESLLTNNTSSFIARPFDLSGDYMLRVGVYDLGLDQYALVLVLHHIASDGWSIPILFNELQYFYNNLLAGASFDLPDLPIQYSDYSIWQRSDSQVDLLSSQLSFWKDRLSGVPVLELPTDYVRPSIQSTRGSSYSFSIDSNLSRCIRDLVQSEDCSLFMFLLSSYTILLHRYTGQEDICVGTPVANRGYQEIEGLIGFFVNTLALRTQLDCDQDFTSFLQAVKLDTLLAYDHQEVPFEKIVSEIGLERDQSRSALFQTMLVLQNNDRISDIRFGSSQVDIEAYDYAVAKEDLTLYAADSGDELGFSFEYCTDLFDESTIIRMAAHFQNLLEAIVSAPKDKISSYEILSDKEKNQILKEFNQYEAIYPDQTILDVFERQLRYYGEKEAIINESKSTSYSEVDLKSNQFAKILIGKGVEKGDMIPVCMDRSSDLIISILAILKVGAVYVPVDPKNPLDRVKFILQDIDAAIIISTTKWKDLCQNLDNINTLYFDELHDSVNKHINFSKQEIIPDQVAYVIYTSGTTGNPKGVQITHRSLHTLLNTMSVNYPLDNNDRLLFKTVISFDVSIYEIFGWILRGATLVMYPTKYDKDVQKLIDYTKNYNIRQLQMVPSLFSAFLDTLSSIDDPVEFPSLKYIFLAGEALPPLLIEKYKSLGLSTQLVNIYGPTENTVYTSHYTIDNSKNYLTNSIPIGKPLHNVKLYIVDSSIVPVPIGVQGELCIGGSQLAEGYHNRKELSEEKFVKNPFEERIDSLLYRTGDTVKWLPDGNIEFVGRKDAQVKIRGYRIELGEIEVQLERLPKVKQAIVSVKEDSLNTKRLIGYIKSDEVLDTSLLINELKEYLPEYMIPRLYIQIEEFPLTSSGKVDRKQLPDLNFDSLAREKYIAPQSNEEKDFAEIWQNLLNIDQVGVNDNFFTLGGDSIIAIQFINRARKKGYSLKVRDVFAYQVIRDLAICVKNNSTTQKNQEPLQGNIDLLPIQSSFFEKDLNNKNHYNQSVLVTVPKKYTGALIEKAIQILFKQHDCLRLQYKKQEGKYIGTFTETIPVLYTEYVDVKQNQQEHIQVICTSYQSSLSLVQDLAKFVWIQTPENQEGNRLFITIHHMVVDGVSWRLILEDLSNYILDLYNDQSELNYFKTTSYRDWQKQLSEYAQSNFIQSERPFWKSVLTHKNTLPVDKDYKGITTFSETKTYAIKLDKNRTSTLLKECHQAIGTEINDLLLSALIISLCDWTERSHIRIGLEGHGREELFDNMDTSHTVGWFTTLFPVSLAKNPKGILETIIDVKETLRSIPNKGIGYGVLRYLHQDKEIRDELSENIEEIIFNYLGQFQTNVDNDIFSFAKESKGEDISLENKNSTKLGINGSVINETLQLVWSYDANRFEDNTIIKLAETFKQNLCEIIELCSRIEAPIKTPHDYGLSGKIDMIGLNDFIQNQESNLSIEDIYELSPLQEGMLFHSLYKANANAYVVQMSLDLIGSLDLKRFEESWRILSDKHSALRTAFFHNVFEVPVQCVYEQVKVPVTILDYTHLEKPEQEKAVVSFIEEDAKKPFDLQNPPLIRLTLVHLEDQRTKMIFTNHHILLDGWSLPVILGEMLSIYTGLNKGDIKNRNYKDGYKDYIKYLNNKSKYDLVHYWKEYLKEVEAPSLLPFVDTSITNKIFGNTTVTLAKDSVFVDSLESFAKSNRITVNTILQGVWAYLLSRYTDNNMVVFGTVISGRPSSIENIESRVGLYINTIPLCTRIENDQSCIDWLQSIQQTYAVSREEYGYHSLADIQSEKGFTGSLFDSILVFENYPIDNVTSIQSDLVIENILADEQTNYALSISSHLSPNNLEVGFKYNSKILSDATVSQIKSHFDQVLQQILEVQTLQDVNYLSNSEAKLLSSFNQTRTTYPSTRTVIDILNEQVHQNPDGIALTHNEEQISYKDLWIRSGALASRLQSDNDVIGNNVGILAKRGIDMIVGILGVLRSGGVYVPLHNAYPTQRLNYILEDAGIEKILYTDISLIIEKDLKDFDFIPIDEIKIDEFELFNVNLVQDSLAYIMYTSGSTGVPKGVKVTHKNIMKLVYDGGCISIESGDRVLQWSNFAFDGSIYEIFSCLLRGGTLHLIEDKDASSAIRISEVLVTQNIDVCFLTTALFNALVDYNVSSLSGVRRLLFGGELVSVDHVNRALDVMGPNRLVHVYGPTETVVYATSQLIDSLSENCVPIGSPLSNTQIYIVNNSFQLCGIGVTGEICIGGDGVSAGYLNKEKLAKERFIDNPFGEGVLYCTGDLGRWLRDGSIDFIGRKDNQVKIRGYRIELGDVESGLQSLEMVDQSLVLADSDPSGGKRLISYVVCSDKFDKLLLESELEGLLPKYMIPSFIIQLESFPLTPNGKIDRKALPKPGNQEIESVLSIEYTAAESQLIVIWEDVLKIDSIGIEDNFFEQGGHSILAIRLISQLRETLKIDLGVETVFQYPVLKEMAKYIENKQAIQLPKIHKQDRKENIPLSFSQERLWFIDQLAGTVAYHSPIVLKVEGILDDEVLLTSIKKVLNRHEALRTIFVEKEGVAYQELLDENYYNITIHHKIEDNTEFLNDKIKTIITKPFDLAVDFKLRTDIIPVENNVFILTFVFHHISSDGWSVPIFIKELEYYYQEGIENENNNLSKLPIQYLDYSIWQRQHLSGSTLNNKLHYWIEQLNGATPYILSTDYLRPPIQQTEGASYHFEIPLDITISLKQYFTKNNATLFMGLLGVFKVLLYRYSGQQDISIGTPVANRSQREIANLIGYFANTVVIRSILDGKMSFSEYLEIVKKTTTEALEYQDVPFEKIVSELVVERDRSRNPLFQIMFIMQNNEQIEEINLGSSKISPLPIENTNSTFDLTCSITENQGGLFVMFEYCTALFAQETIHKIAEHYKILIDEILTNPDESLDKFQMVTPSEKHKILHEFNNRKKEYPKETVIDLFKKQTLYTPNLVALYFGNKELTYKELDTRSDQFANMLWESGAIENELIPICTERSLDMITAILGILKIGAAYVPIDPQYPIERIHYILEDIQAKRIITHSELADTFTKLPLSYYHYIDTDDVEEKLTYTNPISKEVNITSDQLAYIIYTSGTTGKPKGVMIEHFGVTNLVCNQIELMSITKEDTILQFASFAFDAFVSELFTAINTGASLVMVSKEDIYSKTKLINILLEKKITIATLPPSYQTELSDDLGSLKIILSAGEALNKEVAKKLNKKGVQVVNGYGPTENTIGIAMSTNPITLEDKITIGKPLYNVEVYILNESDQLCAIGVLGELCVSGTQVARGYLNQDKLTEEKFITNPFDPDNKSKLYRTGDLARWMPDGRIEFIGRKDTQVKIRGYRVELSEIELELEELDLIKQAVVLIKEKGNIKTLVAYISISNDIELSIIKNSLKKKLPDYMIPQLFVEMESFPLTINGKINRKALPEPNIATFNTNNFIAPRNNIEQQVASIWAEVLQTEKIGIRDNFFERGGNSILAIKLVAKLQEYFEVDINDIFQYQTIQELVENISYEKNYLKNKLESYITKLKVQELAEQVASKEIKKQKKENETKIKKQKKAYLSQIKGLRKINYKERLDYENVLLFGATGYLGIHVLYELLYTRKEIVTVIVRAENQQKAFEKLHTKFQFYFEEDITSFKNRIQVYKGDISQDMFGLDESTYQDLAEVSDTIINCAANVKHYGELEEFMNVNTHPINRIIDFSTFKKQKTIHHVSTLSIAGYVDGDIEDEGLNVIFTERETDTNQHHLNNYTKSKFEADRIFDVARKDGIQVNIYRVGNLSYHSKTGKFQENIENNAFYNQIRANLFLEAVIDSDINFEISCIDKVAEGIIKLFDKKALQNRNFHLKNEYLLPNKNFVKALNRNNFKVEALDAREFLENVFIKYDQYTELINRFLLHLNIFDAEQEQRALHVVCSEETEYILNKVGFKWNQVKDKEIKLMLDYGRSVNFWVSQD
ncbi:amino acid adenylation domain-containing protein [Aquimarina sp. BL5]|uniref:non-ribosomal peptide synthetase n=1 Tax=Aquimarina sp. BL5 TaxID=1714860 RepID=UPI000E4ECFFD|nr:non-ribosomal peptide synthetase [Aquimarina sp. BL5]AXT51937.1 amino acid adenylation domain-containing protein [Aquimarina sp. BL5]RKN03798.1 amino acid adenylation domain-containing protein [Aquimarina sp. BL5]